MQFYRLGGNFLDFELVPGDRDGFKGGSRGVNGLKYQAGVLLLQDGRSGGQSADAGRRRSVDHLGIDAGIFQGILGVDFGAT